MTDLHTTITTRRARVLFLAVIVIFAVPSAVSALTYTSPLSGGQASADRPADDITIVSTQGSSTQIAAGVYAIDTETKEVIWSNTTCPEKCYDVDPLGNDSVLFVSKTTARATRTVENPGEYP